MIVQVLLFAQYADAFGPSISLEVEPGTTAEQLVEQIRARAAGLGSGLPKARLAINQRYAGAEEPVHDGDELAVIPPVAGG
jgi:molybdopterin converting factor small subunit